MPRIREYFVALVLAAIFYGVSVAPGPLWQDSGLAQVRVLQRDLTGHLGLALSHPLYYVLAVAAQGFPLGESAFKTNLVSALFGALTIANVFWLLRLMTDRVSATVGAVSLAVSHTFWQHAALAEVYTVSTALLSCELLALWQFHRTGRPYWLALLMLANGLGLSNHLLALLSLACYAVLGTYLLTKRRINWRTCGAAALAWLLGAGLYLWLVGIELRSGSDWRDVARSALFGTTYARNVLNTHIGLTLLGRSAMTLVLNYPTPTALLALLGAAALRYVQPRWFAATLGGLTALHLLWAIHYDVPDQYTFFIPSLVLISILIGLGTARFRSWGMADATTNTAAPRGRDRLRDVLLVAAAAAPALVYVPLPKIMRDLNAPLGVQRELPFRDDYAYFLHPWKTGENGPLRFAHRVIEILPPGSVIIADSTAVRPLHYLDLTGRWPASIRVFPPPGGGDENFPRPDDLAAELAAGRVFVVTPREKYCPDWLLRDCVFRPHDIVFRALPATAPP
jgi:hypothetical protein